MKVEQLGSPLLRRISEPIDNTDIGSKQTQQLIARMQSVLDGIKAISEENGNAIAAPQVGALKRLILLRINDQFVAMINPKIINSSLDLFSFTEECFSFYHLRGLVARHSEIKISYQDQWGGQVIKTYSGEFSALIQHEIDHLNGVVFLDRMSSKEPLQTVDYAYRNNSAKLAKIRNIVAFVSE